jgi:hypothetical protein
MDQIGGYVRKTCINLSRYFLAALAVGALAIPQALAGTTRNADHMVPTGKGWGKARPTSSSTVIKGYGINYHGGPVMLGNVTVYFIWYGNWNASGSDSSTTVTLLSDLFASSGGIGGSGYENINTTYYNSSNQHVSGNVSLASSTTDNYSQGSSLTDSKVQAIVASAISSGRLPKDGNGLYFVLTSSDVNETSGFCTQYCGWHTHGSIAGSDIKYSFVGNPDRCPSACEMQTVSPNGDSGADGMASIMAHESEEAISDPDLNAWYDTRGEENADKCAWQFGALPAGSPAIGNGAYNETFCTQGSCYNWLIQMNWENKSNTGCEQTLK